MLLKSAFQTLQRWPGTQFERSPLSFRRDRGWTTDWDDPPKNAQGTHRGCPMKMCQGSNENTSPARYYPIHRLPIDSSQQMLPNHFKKYPGHAPVILS